MTKLVSLAAGVTAAAILTACGAPQVSMPTSAPTVSSTTAPAAPAEAMQVVVYTSRSESLFKPVIEAFNRAYPDIKVTMLTGSNGQLAARILEEAGNPQADVLVNSDTLTMADMEAKGAFQPNGSRAVMSVPEAYRAIDGNWVALTLRPRVVMYNTNLVKPDELPKSVYDLIDPKWKGQVGSADSTNGALMANLVALRKYSGDAKVEEFVKGLVANGTKFFGGHTDVRKAVGAGELKLGFVNHYYYHLSKAEGAPVGIIYPDQDSFGLIVNTTNAGIIKGAKNSAAAKLFIDFMLSADGQKVFAQANFEYPIVKDVPLAEGVTPLDSFKLADVTLKSMYEGLDATKAIAQKAGLP
jgi:iron(III) transport system substrate-binding protein